MSSDIFQFFSKMNAGDISFVDEMTEEEVKKLSPYVLLMWTATDKSARPFHVLSTAHVVSDKVFSLQKHPRLLLKLFIAVNGGISNTRYAFSKQARVKNDPSVKNIALFYGVTETDAAEYKSILSASEIDKINSLFEEKNQ